jgi:hypothetical protein
VWPVVRVALWGRAYAGFEGVGVTAGRSNSIKENGLYCS